MERLEIKIKKLHPDAKVPSYGSPDSAGFDLYSVEEVIIPPGEVAMVRTGLAFEIPKGYCVLFWDRSGMGSKGIHRFAGVVDSDYRGEYRVILYNSTRNPYKIEKGDRVVQALISQSYQADFIETDNLGETQRGAGGFGSTGN